MNHSAHKIFFFTHFDCFRNAFILWHKCFHKLHKYEFYKNTFQKKLIWNTYIILLKIKRIFSDMWALHQQNINKYLRRYLKSAMSKARTFWGSLEYHGEQAASKKSKAPFPLQKSSSEVIQKRGFKPSDRYDPKKKQFLTDLSTKFWGKNLVSRNPFFSFLLIRYTIKNRNKYLTITQVINAFI